MLITFAATDPLVKSRLLQYYCLSLYGCAIWNLSSPALHSLEVAFNNILRRIWQLPRSCHTRILHLTSRLPSLINTTANRSLTLLNSAKVCSSKAVRTVFNDSALLAYTPTGYNALYSKDHIKIYYRQDGICASVIRHQRLCGSHSDSYINDMIYVISSS